MLNIDKYLSVTWQMGGRAYPILDCYGLVHEVRLDMGLPSWDLFEGVIKEGDEMDRVCKDFIINITPCDPSPGAVAACYTGQMINHLGVVVSIDGILHVMESNPGKNVSVLPLHRFSRRYIRVEYYK